VFCSYRAMRCSQNNVTRLKRTIIRYNILDRKYLKGKGFLGVFLLERARTEVVQNPKKRIKPMSHCTSEISKSKYRVFTAEPESAALTQNFRETVFPKGRTCVNHLSKLSYQK